MTTAISPNPDPYDAALRALRDCGVIRVRIGAVPRGYRMLQAGGLASAKAGPDGTADVRLKDDGIRLARDLPPTPGGYKESTR